jgi:hypothetical protein
MPNWCNNNLYVSGPSDARLVFALAAKGNGERNDFSLNNLLPCPASLNEVSAGSDEIAYDVMFGDLSKIECYAWIPAQIKGDREALISFLSDHYARPMREIGQKMKDNLDNYGATHWYDWCVKNWGTKWDVDGQLISDDGALSYSFESAWSPPSEGLREISAKFPELVFALEYFENGMCFAGKIVFQNGDVIEDDYRQWNTKEELEEIRDCGCFDFVSSEAEILLEQMAEWEAEDAERAAADASV